MDGNTALALGALFTGLAGIVTAIAGALKMRSDAHAHGEHDCEQHLKDARKEAEDYAAELHRHRMTDL